MRARVALVGALVAFGAAACQSKEAAEQTSSGGPAQAQSGFRVGDQRRYLVQLGSEATIKGQPLTQFDLSGTWVVSTVEDRAGRRVLHTRLEQVRISSKHPQLTGQLTALVPELEKPFGVELGADGAVEGYVFLDSPNPLVVGIRQVIAVGLQVSQTAVKTAGTVEELDGTGRYRAQYRRQADGSVVRQKLSYSALKSSTSGGAAAAELLPKVQSASAVLRLDGGGALESLDSSERLVSGGGQIAPVDSATKLKLALEGRPGRDAGRAPELLATLSGGRRLAAAAVWSADVKDEQFDEARIGGRTLAGVLADYRRLKSSAAPGQGLPEKERGDLFTALSAIIRSQPESRRQVIALVKQHDPLTMVLLDALGAAGEAESQTALAAFLADKTQDESQLRAAAIGLSHTKSPTPEATQALVKLLDVKGLRIQALYGLGSHVATLRAAGEEQRAKDVLAIVLDRLKTADSQTKRITALRAIANSGHEDAFPLVVPYLTDPDDQIRAAAVESLQTIPLSEADEVIATALSSDKASDVRRAAGRAALLRKPTPRLVAAAKSAALTDKNPHVRLTALQVLAKYQPLQSDLLAVIQDVSKNDPEEAIRREAERAMAGRAPG